MCTHAELHFIPTDVSHGCVAANEQRSTKLRAPNQEHQTFTLVWFDWRVQKSHREALGSRFSSVKGKHANFIPSESLSTIYSNNEAASIYMLLAGKDGIQAEAGEAAWAPPASVESVVSTRMTPQATGEERHDLEPTTPRGDISASALCRWCLLSENAFDGSARTWRSQRRNAGEMVTRLEGQECSPIAAS